MNRNKWIRILIIVLFSPYLAAVILWNLPGYFVDAWKETRREMRAEKEKRKAVEKSRQQALNVMEDSILRVFGGRGNIRHAPPQMQKQLENIQRLRKKRLG